MKGHIRRRGPQSWAIVLDLGRDAEGKRRQKWHSIKGTRREAEKRLTDLVKSLHDGDYVEPARMDVAEYLRRWLTDYAGPNVSPKSLERYVQIVENNLIPAIGHHRLATLKPLHIQSLYSKALLTGRHDGNGGLSPQTVLHFHRVLHKALSQAVKWQLLARNPADAVDPPKPERKTMRALDEEETAALLTLFEDTSLHMPVLLAVTTGLRRGEILALRWEDIDLKTGKITVLRSVEQTGKSIRFKRPKTERSSRNVALPSFTVEALRQHRIEQATIRLAVGPGYNDNNLVCARETGELIPPNTLSTNFASTIRRTGFPHVRFHDLRHTHASQLLKQGVHPKVVSERLGHSNIGITLDTYSHVMPGLQESAMEGLDASLRSAIGKKPDRT
ncbi:MAG: site-specific integrase [Nitratireductor sp.]